MRAVRKKEGYSLKYKDATSPDNSYLNFLFFFLRYLEFYSYLVLGREVPDRGPIPWHVTSYDERCTNASADKEGEGEFSAEERVTPPPPPPSLTDADGHGKNERDRSEFFKGYFHVFFFFSKWRWSSVDGPACRWRDSWTRPLGGWAAGTRRLGSATNAVCRIQVATGFRMLLRELDCEIVCNRVTASFSLFRRTTISHFTRPLLFFFRLKKQQHLLRAIQ